MDFLCADLIFKFSYQLLLIYFLHFHVLISFKHSIRSWWLDIPSFLWLNVHYLKLVCGLIGGGCLGRMIVGKLSASKLHLKCFSSVFTCCLFAMHNNASLIMILVLLIIHIMLQGFLTPFGTNSSRDDHSQRKCGF